MMTIIVKWQRKLKIEELEGCHCYPQKIIARAIEKKQSFQNPLLSKQGVSLELQQVIKIFVQALCFFIG